MIYRTNWSLGFIGVWALWAAPALAQLEYEEAPIHYGKGGTADRVAKLATALETGELKLAREGDFGYLKGVLEFLEVPADSQTLVFSKTSFQLHKIDPHRPRAVYFNDDTYVGWVQGGEVLELGSTDPQQGAMFYTLERTAEGEPRVLKDQGQCLICHSSVRTQSVPGFLVRSVYSNPAGRFVSGTPTYVTDDRSPFSQRWGGWYVTGQHGSMRHLGNVVCTDEATPGWVDVEAGANQLELPKSVNADRYLEPGSDLIALMVLEHQSQMQNLITRASFEARTAAYQDAGINEALDRPSDYQSGSTQRRIANVSERLLAYLLMSDAIKLEAPISGTSGFASRFSQRGPHDSRGRSLYQLDLKEQLFRYPCSFLIYSASFDALPQTVKSHLGLRLYEILVAETNDDDYQYLSSEIRRELRELLSETKSDFWSTFVATHAKVAAES